MKTLFNNIVDIFDNLIKNPDKSEEIAANLCTVLNAALGEEGNPYKPVECNRVWISKNVNSDPFYITVIPELPTGTNIITADFLFAYDVDIDIDHLISKSDNCGFTAQEMAAWLMHELYSNIITDTTFLRYKKLFISYYDVHNKAITAAHNNLGYLSWFGVFSNTAKDTITDASGDLVADKMRECDAVDFWNTALKKYVKACGGDWSIITTGAIEQDDKNCLEQFNKLARKYMAYAVKYANPDWKILVKYLCENIGSESLKFYITKEPEHIAAIPEKDVYNIFDSRRLMRESYAAENMEINTVPDEPQTDLNPIKIVKDYTKLSNADIYAEISELDLDTKNVYTMSDKLLCAAKLKDFLRVVQDRIAEDPVNEELLTIKEKVYQLSVRLNDTSVSAVSDLEG